MKKINISDITVTKKEADKLLEAEMYARSEFERGFESGVAYQEAKQWAIKKYGKFAKQIYNDK
jgi:hypothetical protein